GGTGWIETSHLAHKFVHGLSVKDFRWVKSGTSTAARAIGAGRRGGRPPADAPPRAPWTPEMVPGGEGMVDFQGMLSYFKSVGFAGPVELYQEYSVRVPGVSELRRYRAAATSVAPHDRPIAGHEPCGVVVAVGVGVPSDFAPIDARVMVHHYKGCGRCKHCRVGWSQLCRNGMTVYGITGHGGHADFMKVPASTLVPLPDELSFEEGAAIS